MPISMKDAIIEAGKMHFEGHIKKHQVNVRNLLHNSVGVAEHLDLMKTIEKELEQIAYYRDLLEEIERF